MAFDLAFEVWGTYTHSHRYRVWDLMSGECKNTLKGHTENVLSVAISADGQTAVSGSEDKTVR